MYNVRTTDYAWYLLWVLLVGYLSWLLYQIAGYDNLSSIANDSVNYLVMARHYSPWADESEAISRVWPLQDFPPLFPLLLAVTGAAHSLLSAHVLVVVLGLVGLYPLYKIAVAISGSKNLAKATTLIFAISPGYILGLQGILSESLYLLLALIFIFQYLKLDKPSNLQMMLMGILLAAAMLTRTVGFVLLLSLLCQGILIALASKKLPLTQLKIAVIALMIYFMSMFLIGPESQSHYLDAFMGFISGRDPTEIGSGWVVVAGQAVSLVDAWKTFFLIYWLGDYDVTSVLIIALLGLSFVGLSVRLRQNRLDAWYTIGCILLLFLWPHPGQMVRLLFPVVPVLLIYASVGIHVFFNQVIHRKLVAVSFYAIICASILPAHAFMLGRLEMADEVGMIPVYEAFRKPDADIAKREISIQNSMIDSFKSLRKHIDSQEQLMYLAPSYTAVLSDIKSIEVPYPATKRGYKRIAEKSNSKYLLLTELHPRKTRKGYTGFKGVEDLEGWIEELWCSKLISGHKVACLYKVLE